MGNNLRYSPLTWDIKNRKMLMDVSRSEISGGLRSFQVSTTMTGTSTTNTIEGIVSILTTDVAIGNWGNAIYGKMDFETNGMVSGLAGVICAELVMPNATLTSGNWACFEAELSCPASVAGMGAVVPVSWFYASAWGSGVAEFQVDGYVFNLSGLGTATAGSVFDTCIATPASHSLRILIDGTAYYIMLTNNVDDT